ncbi:MAG TPA: DUF5666 domain-containing protein [Terracidiphilus sp.]|nr:DUF5666 domain-containing protein [Terracidiphilus sp.]
MAGCASGGNGSSTPPVPSGATAVTLVAGSSANDQVDVMTLDFVSITLTSKSGATVSLLPQQENVEFIHLNGTGEPIATANLPSDTYTSATVTVGPANFACIGGISNSTESRSTAYYEYGWTPEDHVTVTLPSPIVVTGNSMLLSLRLLVSQSASWGSANCFTHAQPPSFSITPTFTLQAASTETPETGALVGLRGIVKSVSASQGSIVVTSDDRTSGGTAPDGSSQTFPPPTWTLVTNSATVFEGIPGISALAAGMPVHMDASYQADGSLLAARVAVYDTNTSDLSEDIGQNTVVLSANPILDPDAMEGSGILYEDMNIGDAGGASFNNAQFNVSGAISNLQQLPFPAKFDATSLAAGQFIAVTSHALSVQPAPVYIPLSTVTLLPQIVDATVTAVASSGDFQVYTVSLASYELFPQLANQNIQTTVLTDPQTMTIYADKSVQSFTQSPIAVGTTYRFYGAVFNDSGTLRMDCLRIYDGVPM